MKKDDRVLARNGARDLSDQEVERVTGGFHTRTLTPCIVDNKGNLVNGDTAIGEC